MINTKVVLPFWRHVCFTRGNWTLWLVYREHWDSLTFVVSSCPRQTVNFTLSKNIVCHVQQLYISLNLKLQNKWKPILVKIKWLMKHTIWESFFFNSSQFCSWLPSTKFPEVLSFAFGVNQLTRNISFKFCFSMYQLLSVFQSLWTGIWDLLWRKKVITTLP